MMDIIKKLIIWEIKFKVYFQT